MKELILLVDDEPSILQLARMYLERENFRVEAARGGDGATVPGVRGAGGSGQCVGVDRAGDRGVLFWEGVGGGARRRVSAEEVGRRIAYG